RAFAIPTWGRIYGGQRVSTMGDVPLPAFWSGHASAPERSQMSLEPQARLYWSEVGSAVDVDECPREVAGSTGQQKRHELADFARLSRPLHRDIEFPVFDHDALECLFVGHALLVGEMLAQRMQSLGFHGSRAYTVGLDALGSVRAGKTLGEECDGGLERR